MIWHNGKLTEDNMAPGEHGIFETIRVKDGKAQCLNLHFERMRRSAGALGLSIKWSDEQLTQALSDVIKTNDLTICAARLTVTDDIIIETFPLRYTTQDYEQGYRIGIIEERRIDSPDKYIHKTLANRGKNFLVKKVMTERGFNEGLWINGDEEVCEGIFYNLFILEQSGIIATPPAFCGLLPGITRQRLIHNELNLDIKIKVKVLRIDDILSAKEVFLTNALALAMPVVECSGHKIWNGKPGELTLKIKEALEKSV